MLHRLLFYVSTLLIVFVSVAHVFYASIGPNATETSFSKRYIASLLMPEGWGFFTRNPREEQKVLYQFKEDNTLQLVTYKNSSYRNLFGLSKKSRRLNLEFQRIVSQIPDSSWVQATEGSDGLPDMKQIKTISIKKIVSRENYILSGNYLVKRFTLTPWLWAKYPQNYSNKFYYVHIILS